MAGVRVLHFASTATAFCRFEDDSDNVAFDALMDTVLKAEVSDPGFGFGKQTQDRSKMGS